MKVAIFRTSIPLTIFSVFHVTHDFCDARPVRNTEKWPKNAFWAPPNAGAVRLWSLSSRGRCRNPPAYEKRVIECGDLPYLLLGPGTGATQYRCGNSKVLSASLAHRASRIAHRSLARARASLALRSRFARARYARARSRIAQNTGVQALKSRKIQVCSD